MHSSLCSCCGIGDIMPQHFFHAMMTGLATAFFLCIMALTIDFFFVPWHWQLHCMSCCGIGNSCAHHATAFLFVLQHCTYCHGVAVMHIVQWYFCLCHGIFFMLWHCSTCCGTEHNTRTAIGITCHAQHCWHWCLALWPTLFNAAPLPWDAMAQLVRLHIMLWHCTLCMHGTVILCYCWLQWLPWFFALQVENWRSLLWLHATAPRVQLQLWPVMGVAVDPKVGGRGLGHFMLL